MGEVSGMSLMRRCERCVGTGSLESDDSTDDRWWDCSTCKGTGKVADRRRPDPQLAGAVKALTVREAFAVASAEIQACAENGDDPVCVRSALSVTTRGQ